MERLTDVGRWDALLATRPSTPLLSLAMERALAFLAPTRGGSLLDLGCDNGDKTEAFRQLGWRPTGVDINAATIEGAAGRYPECGFRFGHLEALPFADATFDAAFECSALQYVDLPTALREVGRVLRPGGRAAFIVNLHGHPLVRALRLTRKVTRHRYPPFMTPRGYPDPALLTGLLSDANGWESTRCEPFGLATPLSLYGLPIETLRVWDRWALSRSERLERWCWLAVVTARRVGGGSA